MLVSRPISAVAVLAAISHVAALQIRENEEQKGETVCISIAAYEEPEYISLLIKNALHMSESTTKIGIHLDAMTNYSDHHFKQWESDRVTITPERIWVHPFEGSILYAHSLTAFHMGKTWGSECGYFVLQASNMMWARKGMEKQVRERKYSPLGAKPDTGGCAIDNTVEGSEVWTDFTKLMAAKKGLYGHGQPEGSFFPMGHVLNFWALLKKYMHDIHDDGSGIYNAKCYFENNWLQTFMANFVGDLPDPETYEHRKPLSLNVCHYGDKDNDSVSKEELDAIINNASGFEDYYAVKRVNRHMDHPITQMIAKMSGFKLKQ